MTPKTRRTELARRRLPAPNADRSWLDVAGDVARARGVLLDDVLELRRPTASARALAWAELVEAGYSYPEIARAWGMSSSTIVVQVAKYSPDAAARRSDAYARRPAPPTSRPGLKRCAPAAARSRGAAK